MIDQESAVEEVIREYGGNFHFKLSVWNSHGKHYEFEVYHNQVLGDDYTVRARIAKINERFEKHTFDTLAHALAFVSSFREEKPEEVREMKVVFTQEELVEVAEAYLQKHWVVGSVKVTNVEILASGDHDENLVVTVQVKNKES